MAWQRHGYQAKGVVGAGCLASPGAPPGRILPCLKGKFAVGRAPAGMRSALAAIARIRVKPFPNRDFAPIALALLSERIAPGSLAWFASALCGLGLRRPTP